MRALTVFLILILSVYISPKTKEEWLSRSIYQLLTDRFARTSDTGDCNLNKYCGGNYQGLISKLDYIKGMGFDAIWISPIIESYEDAYHGYQFMNFYKLNSHFGSESDLIALIEACHNKDIWVMIDVVANHVAPIGTDYSRITPFNKAEYYHDDCDITDWSNQWQVENCRYEECPDLKHEDSWVAQTLLDWIKDLVTKYDIDGIRIDTVLEVPKSFWDSFREAAGVFQIGDAFNGDINYVAYYQNYLDSLFNYPLYYIIENAFCGSFTNLESYWFNMRATYPDPKYIATFVENHANPRFLHRCNDIGKFTNAVVFSLLWEGIPVFYYGGEQYYSGGDIPNNREPLWDNYNTDSELYKILGITNSLRKSKSIWDKDITLRYSSDNFFAFTRGDVLACFSNTNEITISIAYHSFSDGDKLCNVLSDGDCVTVSNGSINVEMKNYPKVYVKQ